MISRRSLLGSTLAAAVLAPLAARAGGTGRRLVVVFAKGGWDTTYAIDPKFGSGAVEGPDADPDVAPDEYVGSFGGLSIAANDLLRPSVRAFFERWSAQTAVVNGLDIGAIAHGVCQRRVLSGSPDPESPDVATIVGARLGDGPPLGTLDLSGIGIAGPFGSSRATVGFSGQIAALLDPAAALPAPAGSGVVYPTWTPSTAASAAMADWLVARRLRFAAAHRDAAPRLAQRDDAVARAARLRSVRDVLGELVVGEGTSLLTQLDLAVGALAADISHSVLVDTSLAWDTHADNTVQHGNWDLLCRGLDALMASLQEQAMLDDTSVLVLSEMGRTPVTNATGGKDHWPVTSAMFLGAGVAGGRALGGTDEAFAALPVDLQTGDPTDGGAVLAFPNLAAGVLEWMGVDPEEFFPGVQVYRGFRA